MSRLHVPALGVVRRYRGAEVDPIVVGRELGVDAVLVGLLGSAGTACRVQFELVRVADGRLLLGDVRSTRRERLAAVPAEIATAVGRALDVPANELEGLDGLGSARSGAAWVD